MDSIIRNIQRGYSPEVQVAGLLKQEQESLKEFIQQHIQKGFIPADQLPTYEQILTLLSYGKNTRTHNLNDTKYNFIHKIKMQLSRNNIKPKQHQLNVKFGRFPFKKQYSFSIQQNNLKIREKKNGRNIDMEHVPMELLKTIYRHLVENYKKELDRAKKLYQNIRINKRIIDNAIKDMCKTFRIKFVVGQTGDYATMLLILDKEIDKYGDQVAIREWDKLAQVLISVFDKLETENIISISFSTDLTEQTPFSLDTTNNLLRYFIDPKIPPLQNVQNATPLNIQINPIIQQYFSKSKLGEYFENPKYKDIFKIGIMLSILSKNGYVSDKIWKKLSPFIYTEGRHIHSQTQELWQQIIDQKQYQKHKHTIKQQDRNISKSQYKTFRQVLFPNQLRYRKNHQLANKFWVREVISPHVGCMGELQIRLDVYPGGGYTLNSVDFNLFKTDKNRIDEIKKEHLVFLIIIKEFKNGDFISGHENLLIFTNNQFFYFEPNGTVEIGNIFLYNERNFRVLWEDIVDEIQNQLRHYKDDISYKENTHLQQLLSYNNILLPNFPLSEAGRYLFRQFQRLVESENKKTEGETGGYCVSICLFILDLFKQNCFDETPWTKDRMQSMIDTYLIISIMTRTIHSDIRGFNVSVFRTMNALRNLSVKIKPTTQRRRTIKLL